MQRLNKGGCIQSLSKKHNRQLSKKKCINNPKQKLLEMCDSIPIAPQVDNDKQQINK